MFVFNECEKCFLEMDFYTLFSNKNHTQIIQIIVTKSKNTLTTTAVIKLVTMMTKTNQMATHITHIKVI